MSNAQTAKAPAPHAPPKPAAAPAPAPKSENTGFTGLGTQGAPVAYAEDPKSAAPPAMKLGAFGPLSSSLEHGGSKLAGAAAPTTLDGGTTMAAPARFSIHDNVPMPPSLRMGVSVYPWGDLKVGQSIFIPGKTQKAFGGQVAQAGKAQRKKEGNEGYKLSSRNMKHEGVDGVMVWRIA